MSYLKQNIQQIKKRIEAAAERSGRNPEDIYLIAVTKNFSAELIQEAKSKVDLVKGNIEWHLIGHLQRNKVKTAIDIFTMIQSLDSWRLAEEIQKRAQQADKVIDVLVQVNIGSEETKYGIDPDDTEVFIEKVATLPNLKVRGLMAIAPFKENPEDVRAYFRHLREIFQSIRENLLKMSMNTVYGNDNDFRAIEERQTW